MNKIPFIPRTKYQKKMYKLLDYLQSNKNYNEQIKLLIYNYIILLNIGLQYNHLFENIKQYLTYNTNYKSYNKFINYIFNKKFIYLSKYYLYFTINEFSEQNFYNEFNQTLIFNIKNEFGKNKHITINKQINQFHCHLCKKNKIITKKNSINNHINTKTHKKKLSSHNKYIQFENYYKYIQTNQKNKIKCLVCEKEIKNIKKHINTLIHMKKLMAAKKYLCKNNLFNYVKSS